MSRNSFSNTMADWEGLLSAVEANGRKPAPTGAEDEAPQNPTSTVR